MRLADRRIKTVLVDADLADPRLASRLGILPEAGWEQVVAGRLPLDETLIESLQDRLTLLPLCGAQLGRGKTILEDASLTVPLERLRRNYDLVLVDLGAPGTATGRGGGPSRTAGNRIDAAVLVRNLRAAPPRPLTELQGYLAAAGVAATGIADNFASL
jgi:Mrp family chromosome partitioning ATPase